MMLQNKYQGFRPSSFRVLFSLYNLAYVKHFDTRTGRILTILVEVYLVVLHTKYQGSRLCGFSAISK